MKSKPSKTKESPVSIAIFLVLVTPILFIDSIVILCSSLRKGFYKKEVLSKKSPFGFDFDIIVKS